MLLVYTLEGGPLRCMLLPCCACFPCLSGAWPASPLPPVSVWEGRFGCLKLKRCHFLALSVLATLMNLADIGKVLGLSEGRGGMCGCALSQELCWGRMRFPLISAQGTHRPHHHRNCWTMRAAQLRSAFSPGGFPRWGTRPVSGPCSICWRTLYGTASALTPFSRGVWWGVAMRQREWKGTTSPEIQERALRTCPGRELLLAWALRPEGSKQLPLHYKCLPLGWSKCPCL